MSKSDEIFRIENGNCDALPARSLREGFLGKSLEEALQKLLEENPNLIPGKQIAPSSELPPKFALLRREMPLSGWSLDHLFVDQYGVPTLVEAKLIQNPESRREVIGQIIEYAAKVDVRPQIGMRVKLSAAGSGRWQGSGGFRSKFGLTQSEVLTGLEELRRSGMEDCLKLLHYHLGSQVTNIKRL